MSKAKNKLQSALGFSARARKLVSGAEMVHKAITSGRAHIVFVDAVASVNTVKKLTDSCLYYGVPLYRIHEEDFLANAIGKESRLAVALCDENLANLAIKSLKEIDEAFAEALVPIGAEGRMEV